LWLVRELKLSARPLMLLPHTILDSQKRDTSRTQTLQVYWSFFWAYPVEGTKLVLVEFFRHTDHSLERLSGFLHFIKNGATLAIRVFRLALRMQKTASKRSAWRDRDHHLTSWSWK